MPSKFVLAIQEYFCFQFSLSFDLSFGTWPTAISHPVMDTNINIITTNMYTQIIIVYVACFQLVQRYMYQRSPQEHLKLIIEGLPVVVGSQNESFC